MKIFLTFVIVLNSLLLAADTKESASERKKRVEKQIKVEMEKEKKYAREQTFYNQDNYDFKGAEVNKDSLDQLPDLKNQDDFDMDSVYD